MNQSVTTDLQLFIYFLQIWLALTHLSKINRPFVNPQTILSYLSKNLYFLLKIFKINNQPLYLHKVILFLLIHMHPLISPFYPDINTEGVNSRKRKSLYKMGKKKRSFDTVSVSNIYYQSEEEQSDIPSQYDFLAQDGEECQTAAMGSLMRQFRYQLALQQKTIFRGRGRDQMQPSQQELLQITHAIKMNFPDKDTYRIIKLLFENLMPAGMFRVKQRIPNTKRVSQDEVRQTLYKSNPISKVQRNIELVENLQTYGGFKKLYLKSAYKSPAFPDHPGQQYRYRMKKCAASSFIKRGHSQQFFLQQLLQWGESAQIDKNYYHPTLEAVVIQTYKFLQQFIINDCHLDIKILVRQQLKLFSNRLLHCRQTLKKNEVHIFLQLVKAVYGLDDSTVDEYQAVRLYLVTQRGLRLIMLKKIKEINDAATNSKGKKVKNKSKAIHAQLFNDDAKSIIYEKTIENKQAFDLKSMWTIKLQQQFLETYKKIQHFMDIKRYFKQKYPEYKHFFQGTGLRNRLNQILRASLRKVREIAASHQGLITQLTKMDDNLIKYVLKSSRTLRVRLMLVDIYLQDCRIYTYRIEQVIKQLNEAIADKPYYKLQSYSKSKEDSESNAASSTHPANYRNPPHFWEDRNKQVSSFWNQRVVSMKRKTFYKPNPPPKQRGKRNKLFRHMYGDDDKRITRMNEPSQTASTILDPDEQSNHKFRDLDQDSDSPIRINMRPQQPEYYDNTFYYDDS